MPRAFSLVELLVSIALVGVLIALAVPALSSARASARQTVCLANLRGLGTTFESYLQTHKQTYPFAPPGAKIPVDPDGLGTIQAGHWDQLWYWTGLVGSLAPWREHFGAWICPGSPRLPGEPWRPWAGGGSGIPSYAYSNSFIARPPLWSGSAAGDPALLGPVRAQDVFYPAGKVLLYDAELAHLTPKADRDPAPMLLADGHVMVFRKSASTEPVPNPLRDGPAVRLHDTKMGAQGRDY